MIDMRVLLCLATLHLGACAAQHEPVSTYAEQPVRQNINIELPSMPVTPEASAADHELMVQAEQPAVTRPNCQVGFEEIMAEATKKIEEQRHM